MLSTAFILITLTMMLLILAAFWLGVPKASAPLIIIYIIFLFTNRTPDIVPKESNKITILPEKEDRNTEIQKDQVRTESKSTNIQPKPLTFDSKNNNEKNIKTKNNKTVKKPKELAKNNKDKLSTLTVKDIKICKKIYKRTPVGADDVFTNNVDSLYCYTRVQNTGSKKEIKHIWYFENQIMTQVRYNVKKSNIYRSWTKKTILPHQVGKWRVDIHDNHGTIIGLSLIHI